MPELPEVEGVVRDLKPLVEGKTIERVMLSEVVYNAATLGKQCIVKNAQPADFELVVSGMNIAQIIRRSKYIFFHVSKNEESFLLISHLGMSGAWFVVNHLEEISEEKFRKHVHAVFTLNTGELLVYSDIRRFGELRFIKELADHPPLTQMAPEPFDEDACDYFLTKCEKPKYSNKPIKEVIMDGQVISGCGNIYATEALFAVNIRPTRKTSQISKKRKIELFEAIRAVLLESIENGGSTISDYRSVNGGAGNMQDRLKMYSKKVCPACQTPTKAVVIAGRTSTYCPSCQK